MNYRNQSSNYNRNNPMQRGNPMPSIQPMPCSKSAACSPGNAITKPDCNVVVTEKDDCLHDMPLAMAYVPWQKFHKLYNESDAFKNGTIFKELYFDFNKRRCN